MNRKIRAFIVGLIAVCWVQMGSAQTTSPASADSSRALVVLFPDFSSNEDDNWLDSLDLRIQALNPSAVVVPVVLPDMADNDDIREGISKRWIATFTELVEDAKRAYQPTRVVLVGKGTGAVLALLIAANTPGLVTELVAVACPAFPTRWDSTYKGEEPATYLSGLKQTGVVFIHGMDDDEVPVDIPMQFYQQLRPMQERSRMIRLSDAGHNIELHPVVMKFIGDCIEGRLSAPPLRRAAP